MKLGAVFPTTEIGTDPVAIRDFAQTAEELGYSHIVCYDHVLGAVHEGRTPPVPGPYTENDPFHEPLILFAHLSGVTTRIGLTTGVLILPQRQTALVAKQAAELDVLSGGRLRLGVGLGWNPVEYEALGVPFEGRGERLEEQVGLLRALWSERQLDFQGKYHRIDRAGILPSPERKIPIWFGGMSPAAGARAVRLGDGFIFGSANQFARALATSIQKQLLEEDRDPTQFGMEPIVHFSQGPDGWRQTLEDWEKLGATHLSMRAMDTGAALLGDEPAGFTTAREHIDALEVFMREVG
jgi:probable F420-dependent oxidoreductase